MNAVQYIRNVGKSFGYVAIETLKEYNPAISSMASDAKEFTSDLYQSIKDFTSTKLKSGSEDSLMNTGRDFVSDIFKNAREDLMSGNLYNKQRINQADNEAMSAMMGIDFNSFDLDDDFGDFDDNNSNDAIKSDIASDMASAKAISRTVDYAAQKATGAVTTATLKSAEYISRANAKATRALYDLNTRGFQSINTGLGALNANVGMMVSLAEPLTKHMQNSVEFYTKSSEFQAKTLELLGKVVEQTAPASSTSKRSSSRATRVSDLITSDGGLDIRAYADMVMGNIKEYTSLISDVFGMMGGVKGAGKMASASPLGTVMKAAFKKAIPDLAKDMMEDMNGIIGGLFTSMLGTIKNKTFSNPILDLLKSLFVPDTTYSFKFNNAKYNRGKIDWDGESKKALTEVIPEQLNSIIRLLGGNDTLYDYSRGKFVKRSSIKEDDNRRRTSAARVAAGDFGYSLKSSLENARSKGLLSEADAAEIDAEFTKFMLNAITSGNDDFMYLFKDYNRVKELGVSKKTFDVVNKLAKVSLQNQRGRNVFGVTAGVVRARESENDYYANASLSGTNTLAGLSNGSDLMISSPNTKISGQAVSLGVDKNGNDIFYYLSNIANNLYIIASNRSKKAKKIIKNGSVAVSSPVETTRTSNVINSNSATIDSNTIDLSSDDWTEAMTGAVGAGHGKLPNDLKIYLMNKESGGEEDPEMEAKLARYKRIYGDIDAVKGRANKALGKVAQYGKSFLTKIGVDVDRVDDFFDKMSDKVYNTFYGEDGIFNVITGLLTDFRGTMSQIGGIIRTNLFGIKDESGNRAGGIFSNLINNTKTELKNAGRWVFSGFNKDNTESNYNGRRVTKTGIVAVSEGELIIPSELNPFYHKRTNKAKQRKAEQNAIREFWGARADGDPGVGQTDNMSDSQSNNAVASMFKSMAGTFKAILDSVMPQDNGKFDKLKEKISSGMKEIAPNSGAMGAGAVIGTGISLLSGGVISPLLAASAGAAAGLVIRSEKVQELLFGKMDDETKERDGSGLLSKNMSDFITKNAPGMAKGGALGYLGGVFMGSPVLGAVLGSTIGYVKSSDSAKNYLFGDLDPESGERKNNGLISRELQTKFKSSLPKMGLGAGIGAASTLLGGPLGLVGSMMIGAAAGFASDTNKFKDWMFGELDDNGKRKGGFANLISDKLFKPMVELFDGLAHNLQKDISSIFRSATTKILKKIGDWSVRSKLAGRLKSRLSNSRIGQKIVNGVTALGTSPVRFLRNRVQNRALKRGYNIRDRKSESGYMSAYDRYMLGGRGYRNSDYFTIDNYLMNMSSDAEAEELRSLMNEDFDRANAKDNIARRSHEREFRDVLDRSGKFSKSEVNKYLKRIERGEIDEVEAEINARTDLDPETKDNLLTAINKQKKNLSRISDRNAKKAKLAEKLGVDVNDINDNMLYNVRDLLDAEQKNRQGSEGWLTAEDEYKQKEEKRKNAIAHNIAMIAKALGVEGVDDPFNQIKNDIIGGSTKHTEPYQDANGRWHDANGRFMSNDAINEYKQQKASNSVSDVITNAGSTMTFDEFKASLAPGEEGDFNGKRYINVSGIVQSKREYDEANKAEVDTGRTANAVEQMAGEITNLNNNLNPDSSDEEKKKETLWDKITNGIGNLFGGENGILAKLFGEAGILSLSAIIRSAIPVGLAVALASGTFDDLLEAMDLGGKSTNGKKVSAQNGTIVDENGNPVSAEVVAGDGRKSGSENFNDSIKHILANMGAKSLINVGDHWYTDLLKPAKKLAKEGAEAVVENKHWWNSIFKNGTKKAVSEGAEAVVENNHWWSNIFKNGTKKAVSEGGEKLVKEAVEDTTELAIKSTIRNELSKFGKSLRLAWRKVPGLKTYLKFADAIDNKIDDVIMKLTDKFLEAAEKKGYTLLAEEGLSAIPIIGLAFIVGFLIYDFGTGMADAPIVLGLKEVTPSEEVFAGFFRAVKNNIPFLEYFTTFIPDDWLINLWIEDLGPMLGYEYPDIQSRRAALDKEVADLNNILGSNLSKSQYQSTILHQGSETDTVEEMKKQKLEAAKSAGLRSTVGFFEQGAQKNKYGFNISDAEAAASRTSNADFLLYQSLESGNYNGPVDIASYKWDKFGIHFYDSNGEPVYIDTDKNGTNVKTYIDKNYGTKEEDEKRKQAWAEFVNAQNAFTPGYTPVTASDFSSSRDLYENYKATGDNLSSKWLSKAYNSGDNPNFIYYPWMKYDLDLFNTNSSSNPNFALADPNSANTGNVKPTAANNFGLSSNPEPNLLTVMKPKVNYDQSTMTGLALNYYMTAPASSTDNSLSPNAAKLATELSSKENSFSGGSSGFVSQKDSRYSNMRLGNSSVSNMGCGPASAVMALNQYSGNMSNAVRLANGYQSSGGTDAAYFADYYARNGARANYYSGSTAGGQSSIINSIASGTPTVLMGQDTRNRSKANSPFGPNNHYVVANGFDRHGNVIISDPEQRRSRKYSANILRNTKLGIGMSGGRSGIIPRFRMHLYGGGSEDNAAAIWAFFSSLGYSDAATAAIMGNMMVESGLNPAIIQNGGKGPAAGIVQWENYNTKSDRWKAMSDYAASKGRDWTDLESQLEFVHKELQELHSVYWTSSKNFGIAEATPTSYAQFKISTNVDMATRQFEAAFERASKPNMEKRINYAKEFFARFSNLSDAEKQAALANIGSVALSGTAGIDNSSSGTSSSSSSLSGKVYSGLSILTGIKDVFSNAFGSIFNRNDTSSVSEGIYDTNNGYYGTSYNNLPTLTSDATENFVNVALSQKGVKEGPGNDTIYGDFTGASKSPWCMSFVNWCMAQAYNNDMDKFNTALYGGKTASCSALYNRFKQNNRITNIPQRGDIVLYKNRTEDPNKPSGHTGIVYDVSGDTFNSIEGNTSGDGTFDDNGGVVWTKSNKIDSNRVLGFARPNWVPNNDGISISTTNAGSASGSGLGFSAGASGITDSEFNYQNAMLSIMKQFVRKLDELTNNTVPIGSIFALLGELVSNGSLDKADLVNAISALANNNNNSSSAEDELAYLMNTMDSIAFD